MGGFQWKYTLDSTNRICTFRRFSLHKWFSRWNIKHATFVIDRNRLQTNFRITWALDFLYNYASEPICLKSFMMLYGIFQFTFYELRIFFVVIHCRITSTRSHQAMCDISIYSNMMNILWLHSPLEMCAYHPSSAHSAFHSQRLVCHRGEITRIICLI